MTIYRKNRNDCRQLIRDAKRSSWEAFLESINAEQTSAQLWGQINALSGKRRSVGMAIRANGLITRDPRVVADTLADYFASLSSLEKYDQGFRDRNSVSPNSLMNLQLPKDTTGLPINRPFTPAELDFALAKGKGKLAGPDDHGYPTFKHLPLIGKQTFLHLLNKVWLSETPPEEWNHSLVIPIPKNEGASVDPSSFRPIALTCCASKIMERMVNRRLTHFLEQHNHLDHRQHAFRPGHGTGTYFATLGQVLSDAKEQDQHVEIAALDLEKAYNRTWGPNVVKQLQEWGLSGHILAFVRNFLLNRTFQICIGAHKSKICQEETGVPQGSVIAVTLFLVAMNDVFRSLPKEIYIFVYADDIVLVAVQKPSRPSDGSSKRW